MSEPVAPTPPGSASVPPAPVRSATGRLQRWSVLLPALTFLVGGVLGAAIVGVTGQQADGTAAAPVPTAPVTTSPQPTPNELVVRVPQTCLQAAERAGKAYAVLDQAVTAVRDLDARRLQELLDQVQNEQARTRALITACQQQAGDELTQPATPPTS